MVDIAVGASLAMIVVVVAVLMLARKKKSIAPNGNSVRSSEMTEKIAAQAEEAVVTIVDQTGIIS